MTAPSPAPVVTSTPMQAAVRLAFRAAAAATATPAAPPPVTISPIYGNFYADSSYSNGAFDINPSTPPVFGGLYPTLNFTPPDERAGELQQSDRRQRADTAVL